jgi:hypothetical protein
MSLAMEENMVFNEEFVTKHSQSKMGKRRYYPSNAPQSFIRNAVTGVKYSIRVGSREQSLLYKMIDATGVCNADGYVIPLEQRRTPVTRKLDRNSFYIKPTNEKSAPNHTTNHLFYDSPEQCMLNLNITLSPDEISRWQLRNTSN